MVYSKKNVYFQSQMFIFNFVTFCQFSFVRTVKGNLFKKKFKNVNEFFISFFSWPQYF